MSNPLQQVQGIEFSIAYQFLQVVSGSPQTSWPPFDLTGYTWRLRVKSYPSNPAVAIEITSPSQISTDVSTGIVTCTFTSADTADALGAYVDQLIGTPPNGDPDIAVNGSGITFTRQL